MIRTLLDRKRVKAAIRSFWIEKAKFLEGELVERHARYVSRFYEMNIFISYKHKSRSTVSLPASICKNDDGSDRYVRSEFMSHADQVSILGIIRHQDMMLVQLTDCLRFGNVRPYTWL